MKNIKNISILILLLFVSLFMFACKDKIQIIVNSESVEIEVAEEYFIEATVENLENPVFEYKLEGDAISLEENFVVGLKEGNAKVIVSLKDYPDVEAVTVNISVKNVLPSQIKTKDEIRILIDETEQIEYTFEPEIAVATVSFESKNPNVVTVTNEGLVKGISEGSTTIVIKVNSDEVNVTKEINVICAEDGKPTITYNSDYKEKTLVNWNTEFDPTQGVKVEDFEDGDITKNIRIVNDIDTQEYGLQTVQLEVSDSDGNKITFEREIEVIWNYDVKFIAHAGSYFGVQNSEESIRYAIEVLKYQCVEIDLKQTSDGVFVLCHDDTFGDYTIANTKWSVLKNVEVTSKRNAGLPFQNGEATGTGVYTSKICTLATYLQICKDTNTTAVIELKGSKGISNSDQSRMQALMDEIEKYDMLENVIFLASAYNCLIWTRNNGYEYIPCQYLVSSIENESYLQRCIDYNFEISTNTTYGGSNSDEWIARYKDAGIKISTYTYTQYTDYPEVQKWIDKGVDYVTCDWHRMDKLNLPVSDSTPKEKFNVKFVDYDGKVLKESKVEQGKTAAAPKMAERKGYTFIGWDKDLKNVQADTVFTAKYEITKYSITYMPNASNIVESSWPNKQAFIDEFYQDLFNWMVNNKTSISGLSENSGEYTFTRNGVTVKFKSAADILATDIYDFEKTFSNVMYKQVTRNSDGTCTIYEDNNYFLNSSLYRVKYQGVDQWLCNAIKEGYPAYDNTYKVLSSGKIQIFFRMHQWAKGTNINVFNKLPKKYIEELDQTVNPVIPTSPVTYTIEDNISLPNATGNVTFLGWYLNADCTGEQVTSISKGTTGNIVLYAKWDK